MRSCLRYSFCLFLFCLCVVPVGAVEVTGNEDLLEVAVVDYSFDMDFGAGSEYGDEAFSVNDDEPIPVILVDQADFPTLYASGAREILTIGNTPPDNPLFYGSGWISGYDSNLGDIVVYFPIDRRNGTWGVDDNGYLINVSSSSISGYLSGVYNNSVSASGFSYPRYRTSSSSYDYVTLYLKPENSNMHIAVDNEPFLTFDEVASYFSIFALGGVLLCCMKRL